LGKVKEPDYTLNVFHHKDKETNVRSVVFLVQTTKVFVSFQYDILLQAKQEGDAVHIKVQGLHAPELLMPGSGPARPSRRIAPTISCSRSSASTRCAGP